MQEKRGGRCQVHSLFPRWFCRSRLFRPDHPGLDTLQDRYILTQVNTLEFGVGDTTAKEETRDKLRNVFVLLG
ncbi:hypothetical protein KCU93_g114, partial [Aureobasidium melanogenum]